MLRLKALVGIMTFLIFVCFCLMIYGVRKQTEKLQESVEATLALPAVSTIQSISSYDDGLALYVQSTDGDYIYLFSLSQGKGAGRIKIERGGEKPRVIAPSAP